VAVVRFPVVLAALIAAAAPTAHAHDPKTDYTLHCQGCHVADGSGLEGKVPSMRPTLVPLSLFADGRRFLVQVPGVAQSSLSDAETAALLNWMIHTLGEQAPPAGWRAFTADEVARYRATRLTEVRATRAAVLARMQAVHR
jgi:hypothetical protein